MTIITAIISKGNRVLSRSQDQHTLIDLPAIVSHGVWELAQAQRAYNRNFGKRRIKRAYLLREMIYCGCGRRGFYQAARPGVGAGRRPCAIGISPSVHSVVSGSLRNGKVMLTISNFHV